MFEWPPPKKIFALLGCGICGLFLTATNAVADDQSELLFVRRILPLFHEKCLPCHGNDDQNIKGELDLTTLAASMRGGQSELPAIVANDPQASPLYLAVLRTDSSWEAMPPKESDKLSAEQIEWIKRWIASGGSWPDEGRIKAIAKANESEWTAEDGLSISTSGGLSQEWTNRKYKPDGLWAYQPVRKPVVSASQGENPIDVLIAEMLPAGLELAAPADARTMIRRATFDLLGLPPSPEEIASFEVSYVAQPDQAMSQLIDRLLDSPHYGERMAQHWLDVTRYADSSGFANDYDRGNAWRYRDYVIRAFNSDKPYDQFIKEQIAGDEIDPNDPEKIIATGFLRMGPWELTGMEVAKVARQRFLDDVSNSVGETFLAHSLQCARCHDHKFDPIPTRDYYSVQAVFTTTQLSERPAPFLPKENTNGFDERVYLEMTRADHLSSLAKLDDVLLENAQRWFADNGKDPSKWNAAVSAAKRDAASAKATKGRRDFSELFSVSRNALMKQGIAETEFPPKLVGFTPEQFGLERVARKGLERLKWELDRYEPFALAVYDGRTPDVKSVNNPFRIPDNRMTEGELSEDCIRIGGDPFAEGPTVKPGVLSVINQVRAGAIPDTIEGRRKAFADWVASKDNPLTTRAIVNRIWMWHFGEPIAGNPNNFGSTGKRPTHPKLLDWLAATLVEEGWSFKAMHRMIMTSQTYRRSALHPKPELLQSKDPLGISYACFKPRRLTAEELRDAILSASGELQLRLGGIPNRPEIHFEVALQPRQVMGTFASAWTPNPRPEQRHRRSIYALKLRGLSDPMLEVFNTPSPDFACERRENSTVTPQVFALFNSQASHSRALALATRVLKEAPNEQSAITRCFQLVYGRPPKSNELAFCIAHWHDMESVQAQIQPESTKPLLEIVREAVEENTGERFTFRERLYANADFVPDIQATECDARTRSLADVCLALLNSNEFAYVY
jgi:mono/diheme cytochrome c family protein